MKSRRPSSAQWRSSKTSTSGRSRASASSKCRQAAKAAPRSSPRMLRSSLEPDERPEMASMRAASAGPGTRSRTDSPELPLRRLGVVGLEDAGLALDDLAERPERDAVAGTAASAPDASRSTRPPLFGRAEELVDEAALADPGLADDRHELGRATVAGRRSQRPEQDAPAPRAGRRAAGLGLLSVVEAAARARRERRTTPGPARPCPSLDRLGLHVVDDVARRAVGRVVDEDAVDGRRGLEARRRC